MFSVPRVNVIASDEGFEVEVLGRTGLRYAEGGREMRIDSEVVMAPGAIVVYSGSIGTWKPPHQAETVDDARRSAIIGNIRRAFAWQGHAVDVF